MNAMTYKSVIIVGGGVMGLGTAFHLAEKGYKVTVLEKANDTATVASNLNGGLLCPSMCVSWANIQLNRKFRGELKQVKLSWAAITDPNFWSWAFWFIYNGLWPGKSQQNDIADLTLADYSRKCMLRLEDEYGDDLSVAKSASNTLKLFHDQEIMDRFVQSSQAKFWSDKGHPFKVLSPEECFRRVPLLSKEDSATLVGGTVQDPPVDTMADIKVFCRKLESMCLKRGVTLLTNTTVTSVIRDEEGIAGVEAVRKVDGPYGTSEKKLERMTADVYVLAVGVESYRIGKSLGITLPVYPMRGSLFTAPIKEEYKDTFPSAIVSTLHGVVVGRMEPGIVRASSEVQAMGFDHGTCLPTGAITRDKTLKVLNGDWLDMEAAAYKSALRPLCADDVPIVGQSIIPNLYVNSGHGSKGWTQCFGSIRLLADIIDGSPTEIDSSPYTPKRFHPVKRHL